MRHRRSPVTTPAFQQALRKLVIIGEQPGMLMPSATMMAPVNVADRS